MFRPFSMRVEKPSGKIPGPPRKQAAVVLASQQTRSRKTLHKKRLRVGPGLRSGTWPGRPAVTQTHERHLGRDPIITSGSKRPDSRAPAGAGKIRFAVIGCAWATTAVSRPAASGKKKQIASGFSRTTFFRSPMHLLGRQDP